MGKISPEIYLKLGMMFRAMYLQIEGILALDEQSASGMLDELSEACENVARKHLEEISTARKMHDKSF